MVDGFQKNKVKKIFEIDLILIFSQKSFVRQQTINHFNHFDPFHTSATPI